MLFCALFGVSLEVPFLAKFVRMYSRTTFLRCPWEVSFSDLFGQPDTLFLKTVVHLLHVRSPWPGPPGESLSRPSWMRCCNYLGETCAGKVSLFGPPRGCKSILFEVPFWGTLLAHCWPTVFGYAISGWSKT